ncbi:MAG: V-type ATP synthase subunit D [Thermoprotei archaeon]
MEKMQIPPTRFNLLKLKRDYVALQIGHDLLEQKREALLEEIKKEAMSLYQQRRICQQSLDEALQILAKAEAEAYPQMALWGRSTVSVSEDQRSIMGVAVSIFKIVQKPSGKLMLSPGGESAVIEDLASFFLRLIESLSKLAELQASITALAKEMKKTQRRVNALENIFLPQYRETISFISDTLEERDREELVSLKAIKEGHGA